MKTTKQFISKTIQVLICSIVIGLIIALLFFTLTSCSASESLLDCNYNDRVIIGYNKKGTAYIVENACNNHREANIKISSQDTLKVGTWLICIERRKSRY